MSLVAAACGSGPEPAPAADPNGVLNATLRSEPVTYNRLVSAQTADEVFRLLVHDTLVRVNRTTGELEPRLAESWTASPDGRRWTLKLRPVRFSDGTPFGSADVVFTLRALYDPKVESVLADSFLVAGQPIRAEAPDPLSVVLEFPSAHGRGLELFSTLPILPRHKLRGQLDAGTFKNAWSIGTPLEEMAGLGPFVLAAHVPGQRLRFERNPQFWKRDANGQPLPALAAIDLSVVSDQNAEMLRLQNGQADVITDVIRPEDVAALEALQTKGIVRLTEAGVAVDPDGLWFNLSPGTPTARAKPWLHRTEFRQAVSLAVNRSELIDSVFLGQAVPVLTPVTPGHGAWHAADVQPEFDRARAATLLASLGLRDRNGDTVLDDAAGRPVRMTVITQKGHTARERSVTVLRDQLAQVGIGVDVEAFDQAALFQRFTSRAFDAMFFGLRSDTLDPTGSLEFWRSSGGYHVWNPGQATPATPWEAEIDRLINLNATTIDRAERQRLFADVQRRFAEQLPAVYFAAPRLTVATSARVQGAAPSVLPPNLLWNAEHLAVLSPNAPGRR